MKIAVACDHRGYKMKGVLTNFLKSAGHQVLDHGCHNDELCDYPDYGIAAAQAVSQGEADVAVLICGSGTGMTIAANKVPGVRAVPAFDAHMAEMCKRQTNANILCLSADMTGLNEMQAIVSVWLSTEFEGGRHQRRIERIHEYEKSLTDTKPD